MKVNILINFWHFLIVFWMYTYQASVSDIGSVVLPVLSFLLFLYPLLGCFCFWLGFWLELPKMGSTRKNSNSGGGWEHGISRGSAERTCRNSRRQLKRKWNFLGCVRKNNGMPRGESLFSLEFPRAKWQI